MTLSERYQIKLDRFRLHQEQLSASKLERHKAELLRRKQVRDLKYKSRHLDSRYQLLRIQGYKCAICRRHKDECGKRGLIADCFGGSLVRGLICGRCNKLLSKFKDNPRVILNQENINFKLRMSAIKYLENWPSSRLDEAMFLINSSKY